MLYPQQILTAQMQQDVVSLTHGHLIGKRLDAGKIDKSGTQACRLLPTTIIRSSSFTTLLEISFNSSEIQSARDCRKIPRHYGKLKEAHPDQPVYCLFVAPKLSAGSVAHFFNLNRFNTKLYGGQTNILPLSLGQFRQLMARAKEESFNQPTQLENLIKTLIESGRSCDDEDVWLQQVKQGVDSWLQT